MLEGERVAREVYRAGSVVAGRYWLERLIARGGQASVWQSRDRMLGLRVALKVVQVEADPLHGQRLLREARAVARLGHPSIVRLFDLGCTSRGEPFLVMELLEGETLADWITRRGRLEPVLAVRLLLPIAAALACAHRHGLVHRDLKPANVFLARRGAVIAPKLLDFGLVKLKSDGSHAEPVTGAGVVVGSPAYLSPEQARAQLDVDARTDVWAFCVTLYECLTGDTPFDPLDFMALLCAIAEDEPRPPSERHCADPDLWAIVRRGLAKTRERRWPSMGALGHALSDWLARQVSAGQACAELSVDVARDAFNVAPETRR